MKRQILRASPQELLEPRRAKEYQLGATRNDEQSNGSSSATEGRDAGESCMKTTGCFCMEHGEESRAWCFGV